MNTRTRWGIGVLAGILATGWAVAGANSPAGANGLAGSAGSAAAASGLAAFEHQRIAWHGCQRGPDDTDGMTLDQAGAQCADVTVPLDYAYPGGRTITVAISRVAATDPTHRIGPLIINTGGPATPNLVDAVLAAQAMGGTGARFDLIGMDQRFSGRSTPLDCGWPAGWLRSAGTDRRSFDRSTRLARDLAVRCAPDRDVLPHASTADAARDMDVIRAALGAPTLSYVGYSYGTYLGALYTQLFPAHAGRIVLDSAIDPAHPGVDKGDNGPEREAALGDWASWAAQRDGTYHLGTSAAAVLSTVDGVYAASARRPLRVGPYTVDDTLVAVLLLDPLSDDGDDSSATLAATVQVLAAAAAGHDPTPAPALADTLAGALTGVNSALDSARVAIMCADAAVPADSDVYFRRVQAHRASAPLFSPVAENISPCAFWPARPVGAPPRVGNAVPALVVHADGDINATSPLNEAMHAALTGSRMITLTHTRTHGVYLFRGSSCVDTAVNAYLGTGTLPPADLSC